MNLVEFRVNSIDKFITWILQHTEGFLLGVFNKPVVDSADKR